MVRRKAAELSPPSLVSKNKLETRWKTAQSACRNVGWCSQQDGPRQLSRRVGYADASPYVRSAVSQMPALFTLLRRTQFRRDAFWYRLCGPKTLSIFTRFAPSERTRFVWVAIKYLTHVCIISLRPMGCHQVPHARVYHFLTTLISSSYKIHSAIKSLNVRLHFLLLDVTSSSELYRYSLCCFISVKLMDRHDIDVHNK
jgi:hypothetical protein